MTETNLYRGVAECLREPDPARKVACTAELAARCRAGLLSMERGEHGPSIPDEPGRPPRPELVAPRRLSRRRLHDVVGRAALIHAVAHIELNAINLALDAALRFGGMPREYYLDWIGVAGEEARHFTLMRERLRALGYDYGDFPAHDGLWEMARRTAGDALERMALVPRVLEARGLDVTPGMIERLRGVGDEESAGRLAVILRDEVGHVAIGSRWFRWICGQRGLEPRETYLRLIRDRFTGRVRCPLNVPDRRRAGFDETEIEALLAMCGERVSD